MVEGLQGLYRQLALDYSRGYDTPYKLMSKYAPASDGNNTEQYAAIIAKAIGLASSRDKMDLTDGDQMQAAMSWAEPSMRTATSASPTTAPTTRTSGVAPTWSKAPRPKAPPSISAWTRTTSTTSSD